MSTSLQCLFFLAASGLPAAAQVAQAPAFDLPGEAPVIMPQTETPKFNVSTVALGISSDFDDNALNNARSQQADFVVLIRPHLGWRVSGARLEWAVDYAMGLARSQKFAAYDSFSHLLDGSFDAKIAKRLRLQLHEAFLSSTNPFDQLQASESATDLAARTVAPETATVTPADVRTEAASVDVLYILSGRSTAGVGGEFFGATYRLPSGTVSPNQVLQNSSSAAGRSYYMRQVTRHQWAGLDYTVRKSTFNSGLSSSFVESLAYSHTIAISPATRLSFFVGPERSVTQNVIKGSLLLSEAFAGARSSWQWSGGVTGTWSGKRTSVSARLSRRINNGGLLGASQHSISSAEVSRQLAQQWTTRLLASYDQGNALVGDGALSCFSVAAGLTRRLAPNLLFEFQYWRVHMSGNGSLPAILLADHNRISMSLVYEHQRSLGQ